MQTLRLIFISCLFFLCSCSNATSQSGLVHDFESCVAAGNAVLRSFPPKCAAPGVGVFTKELDRKIERPKISDPVKYD